MELFRALAVLVEPPHPEAAHAARALGLGALPSASDYTETFVFQLYPYLSVYLGREGMLGGEARDRVAGFWRALGQTPPTEPDHLPLMLALYARLGELETEAAQDAARSAGWRAARKAFLWEHLLSWLDPYVWKLSEIGAPFYRAWGELLMQALLAEAAELGVQETLAAHLREVEEGVADPRQADDGRRVEEFRQTLLSPARTGMILARADFVRAARELKLGLRLGERKFVLDSLLSQDAAGVLEWLSREAARWARHHEEASKRLGETARNWAARAERTVRLLDELKRTAKEMA